LGIFEEARDFFLREQPSLAGSPPPATIVGFNSYKDYKPYSPNSAILAYYLRDEPGDSIVLSDLDLERTRVAIHEYVHLLVSHSGLSIPLWLNEGMAEVYSTLEAKDGKLVLGEMKRDRVLALGRQLDAASGAAAGGREFAGIQRSRAREHVLRPELPPGTYVHAGRRLRG
jgi:hypothetical protein